MLLPFFSAVLGIAAFPPVGWWPLGFIYLVPFFIFLIQENKFSRLVLGALLFRVIFGFGILYFAFEPFITAPGILIFFGLPVTIWILKRVLERLRVVAQGTYIILALLPFLWVFWDYVSTRFTFLPPIIGTTGNAFGSSPFLGLAGLGGLLGLGFFAAFINTLFIFPVSFFAEKFLHINKEKVVHIESKRTVLTCGITVVILIIGAFFLSRYILNMRYTDYTARERVARIALISTNAQFDERAVERGDWNTVFDPIFKEVSNPRPDIVIFPETMIEKEYSGRDEEAYQRLGIENQGPLIAAYRNFAMRSGVFVAATFPTIEHAMRYKSTFIFSPQGSMSDRTQKSRLTIATEYWPFGGWRPFYYDMFRSTNTELGQETALFDSRYEYKKGIQSVLRVKDITFASLICLEVHYPYDLSDLTKKGARFFSHTSNNRWMQFGLSRYLALTDNLRKIEAVWLGVPIVVNGRYEKAGIIKPDGTMEAVPYESPGKNYGIFVAEVRY